MRKELFDKIAVELSTRYTKDELADKLIKFKEARISNLITAAFNKKCILEKSKKIPQEKIAASIWYYSFLKRTIGPESHVYKFPPKSTLGEELAQPWDLLEEEFKQCKNEDELTNLLYKKFIAWERNRTTEKIKSVEKAKWMDEKFPI